MLTMILIKCKISMDAVWFEIESDKLNYKTGASRGDNYEAL
ncbi:hypothetical protein [Clostridium sp. E02]|nr:hypothetical protein [Clostridium sp. E02]